MTPTDEHEAERRAFEAAYEKLYGVIPVRDGAAYLYAIECDGWSFWKLARAKSSSAPAPAALPKGEVERVCFSRAMEQWKTSLSRPDLSEEDRVKGVIARQHTFHKAGGPYVAALSTPPAPAVPEDARELAELVLSMTFMHPPGQFAKRLACRVLGLDDPFADPDSLSITTNGTTRIIPKDEPVFLIRGQDAVSGEAVRAWADLAEAKGAAPDILSLARDHAAKMDAWAHKKTPDLTAAKGQDTPAGKEGGHV